MANFPKKISKSKEFKKIKQAVKDFESFLKSKKWIDSKKDFATVFGDNLEYRLYFLYRGYDQDTSTFETTLEEATCDYLSVKFQSYFDNSVERLRKSKAAKMNSNCSSVLIEHLYAKIEKCLIKLDIPFESQETAEEARNKRVTAMDTRPVTEIVDDQVPGTSNSGLILTPHQISIREGNERGARLRRAKTDLVTPSKQPKTPIETPLRSSTRKKRPISYRDCSESDSDLQGDDMDANGTNDVNNALPALPATSQEITPASDADSDGFDSDFGIDDNARRIRQWRKKKNQGIFKKTPKTNQQKAKEYRDRQFKESDTDEDKDDIQEPEMSNPIDLGEYDNICPFCNAIHFAGARTCCNNGKVFFPPLKALPDKLEHYIFNDYLGKSVFKNRILSYNCAFAMASMSYHQADIAPHGVQIVKPTGNVGHYTSCVTPANDNSSLAFGNFYVYQGMEALQMRQNAYSSLSKQILTDIQEVMDKHNALGRYYKTMGAIMEEEKKKGNDLSYMRMKIVDARQFKDRHGLGAHEGIYADPMISGDHVALFYHSSLEQQVKLPGLNIYGKRRPKLVPQPIQSWDCRISALCYPLLYPYGEIPYRRKYIELYLGDKQRWTYTDRLIEWAAKSGDDASKWELKPNAFDVMAGVNLYLQENPNWEPSTADPNIAEEPAAEDSDEDPDDFDFFQHYSRDDTDAPSGNRVEFIEIDGEYYPIPANRDVARFVVENGNDGSGSEAGLSDLDDDLLDGIDEDNLPIGDENDYDPRANRIDDHPTEFTDEDNTVYAEDNGGSAQLNQQDDEETAPHEQNIPDPEENKKNRRYPSFREYLLFSMQQRDFYRNRYSSSGRLGQLFLTDNCARLYEQRYEYKKQYHTEYVNSTKKRLIKNMEKTAEGLGRKIGCLTTMPPSEPGSPRYLQKLYEHAVAMCNNISTCDLFITATCNVNWPEIKKILKPGETWADHPLEVNKIFKKRFDRLLEMIIGKKKNGSTSARKKGVFGRVKWYTYSIEFQQRGPPHAHLIVSLKRKIKNVRQVDKVCQATIPADNAELRELVEDFQIHRPCEDDPEAYCRIGNKTHWKKCRKGFPKPFAEQTELGDRSYPDLKRPKETEKCFKHGFEADNRHVVAYNTTLLTAWCGHLNVEVISTLKVVKYIFKYLFKGYDRALVEALTGTDHLDGAQMTIEGHLMFPKNVTIHPGAKKKRQQEAKRMLRKRGIPLYDNNDQPTLVLNEYWICQDMRALSPNEAAWEIQGFPRHGSSHTVVDLFVHEEDEEPIRFKDGEEDDLARKLVESGVNTRFNAWMKLNRKCVDAHHLTYNELPKHFKFVNGQWVKKDRKHKNLFGRVRSVHPRNKELFAIRLLSGVQKGVQSFEDLRTVDGIVHTTYVSAAKALGLMNDQEEWRRALREAASEKMPSVLRRLFTSILVFNIVENPLDLWNEFKKEFFENKTSWTDDQKEAHALYHIRSGLAAHGFTLNDYNLPEANNVHLPAKDDRDDDSGVSTYSVNFSRKEEKKLVATLNEGQMKAFKAITEDIDNRIEYKDDCYFVDGSGGTGKTRLFTALYHHFNARGETILCVAHTGIAAMLLPFGSTAHRAFHIPMTVEEGMRAKVHRETVEANLLKKVSLVIWDEATMTDRRIFDCVDQLLRDLHDHRSGLKFAGVPFIFGGDWKQTLPIVDDVKGEGVVQYTMRGSTLWGDLKKLTLTENMRAKDDPEFAEFCAQIGNGSSIMSFDEQWIEFKSRMHVSSENLLIEKIFGTKDTPENKREVFAKSSILTVDNKTTFDVNNKVLKLIDGEEYEFKSIDEYHPNRSFKALEPETYHTQTPSGMPLHKLKLKVGAVVLLLRNVNVFLGLVNGARLRVEKIGRDVIYATPINPGRNTPKTVAIHRMMFCPPEKPTRETSFVRTQFPIRLAFCITCNRAQGQTLDKAGILLRTPCFSHGQLYVAMSRVRTFNDIFIHNACYDISPLWTPNIVYQSALTFGTENDVEMQEEGDQQTLSGDDTNEEEMAIDPPADEDIEQGSPRSVEEEDQEAMLNAEMDVHWRKSPAPTNLLKLVQHENNCFANNTMQVVNYLWRTELLEYEEDDEVILTMQKVVRAEITNTRELLKLTPGTENFNNGGHHDADEYLLHLLDCLEKVPAIRETFEINKHVTDTCNHKHCQTVSHLAPVNEQHIRITNNEKGLTIEDHIQMLQTEETVEKCCPDPRHKGKKDVRHTRATKFVFGSKANYLIMHMTLWANSGFNQRLLFNDRQMNYQEVNNVFDCTFKPIVMFEYTGNRVRGHYRAHVRNEQGWLCIDADSHTQQQNPPAMKNISLIVLKKQSPKPASGANEDVRTEEAAQVPTTSGATDPSPIQDSDEEDMQDYEPLEEDLQDDEREDDYEYGPPESDVEAEQEAMAVMDADMDIHWRKLGENDGPPQKIELSRIMHDLVHIFYKYETMIEIVDAQKICGVTKAIVHDGVTNNGKALCARARYRGDQTLKPGDVCNIEYAIYKIERSNIILISRLVKMPYASGNSDSLKMPIHWI